MCNFWSVLSSFSILKFSASCSVLVGLSNRFRLVFVVFKTISVFTILSFFCAGQLKNERQQNCLLAKNEIMVFKWPTTEWVRALYVQKSKENDFVCFVQTSVLLFYLFCLVRFMSFLGTCVCIFTWLDLRIKHNSSL